MTRIARETDSESLVSAPFPILCQLSLSYYLVVSLGNAPSGDKADSFTDCLASLTNYLTLLVAGEGLEPSTFWL